MPYGIHIHTHRHTSHGLTSGETWKTPKAGDSLSRVQVQPPPQLEGSGTLSTVSFCVLTVHPKNMTSSQPFVMNAAQAAGQGTS